MTNADDAPPVPAFAGNPQPAASGASSTTAPSGPGADVHAELLSRIWQQSLPLMRERVTALQQAALLAAADALAPDARTKAADLAHKLAGSLGMFGFPRGTDIAREMEQMLEAQHGTDATRLVELAIDLRATLAL